MFAGEEAFRRELPTTRRRRAGRSGIVSLLMPLRTRESPAPRKKSLSKARSASVGDPRVQALLGAFRADPALAPVIDAYEKQTGEPGRKFGSNALKVNGKLFALFTQGTLVVKLSKDRVVALVDAGTGEAFDPGHGRVMKEWLTVTSAKASWIDLAREAHGFVRSKR